MLQVKLEKPTRFNCSIIALGRGHFSIVDKIPSADLWTYKWRPVKWHRHWYAIATTRLDGSRCRVSMHRLIANTPPGEVCHHLNKNSLDNRRCNHLNVQQVYHLDFHGVSRFSPMIRKKTR